MPREVCDNHILFVGFMGSGKSSVSRRLSAMTGLSLIDVDQRIVATQHRSIPQIFDDEGEKGFRRIETQTLAGIAYESRSIVSCGGGIVCNAENRSVLAGLGTVIYLSVGLEEAIGRITHPETRPMLSGPRPVAEIYDERLALYDEVADICIDSSGKSIQAVASACREALVERGLL